jgi:hypothetical protein
VSSLIDPVFILLAGFGADDSLASKDVSPNRLDPKTRRLKPGDKLNRNQAGRLYSSEEP